MSPAEIVIVSVVLAAAVALVAVWARRRVRTKTATPAAHEVDIWRTQEALELPPEFEAIFASTLSGVTVTPDQPIVLPDPDDETQVIVLGSDASARSIGEVVGSVPAQLAGKLVGVDALLRAGIAAGEGSGMLVRVTAESAEALRQGRQVFDSSGKLLAVVQGANGKMMHVLRIQPMRGLQALTAGTGALSAIAMQAPLASMEKKLEEILEGVHDLQATAERQEQAALDGMDHTLQDLYGGARSRGVLTQAAWDQLAPLGRPIHRQLASAESKVESLIDEMHKQKSTGDRRSWFRKNSSRLESALAQLAQAERAALQFEALRAWWLVLTDDPTAGHYVQQLQNEVTRRAEFRRRIDASAHAALEQARETRFLDWIHSPIDSSKVEPLAVRLRDRLVANQLLGPGSSKNVEDTSDVL